MCVHRIINTVPVGSPVKFTLHLQLLEDLDTSMDLLMLFKASFVGYLLNHAGDNPDGQWLSANKRGFNFQEEPLCFL